MSELQTAICKLPTGGSFKLPSDGWYQLAPLGDFPHDGAEVIQVVDEMACETMVRRFNEEAGIEPRDDARAERFAGLLIDFDHFSLDAGSKSEAAGWIVALEARHSGQFAVGSGQKTVGSGQLAVGGGKTVGSGQSAVGGEDARLEPGAPKGGNPPGAGLWAKIRWSDLGEAAVNGGRYRFLSPVWSRADCEDLGDGRVRPVRLLNAAVTNDPNLKGICPLSNSASRPSGAGRLANAEGDAEAKRFVWTLGDSPDDRHCPSCKALAGQVHSMADWTAAGLLPKAGALYCQAHCHCSLVETEDPATGDLTAVPVRNPPPADDATGNRSAAIRVMAAKLALRNARRNAGCGLSAVEWVAAAKRARRDAAKVFG